MKAIVEGDLVTGFVTGDADGMAVPAELRSMPAERLRVSRGRIIDAGDVTSWHVDEHGQKRLTAGKGRQAITCRWDARLVRDAGAWVVARPADQLARKIKAECRRRIVAVVKDTATQANIAAWASELLARRVLDKGKLSTSEQADIATAREIRAWVEAMLDTSRNLIAASEAGFADDEHWPAPPAGAAALAARF